MEDFDIKKALLNQGEDTVKSVIKNIVMPYAKIMITKSENKYDDMLLPFIGQLEAGLLDLADKIDGEVD